MPALLHPSAWRMKSCSLSRLSCSLSLQAHCFSYTTVSWSGRGGSPCSLFSVAYQSGLFVLLAARVENPVSSWIVLQWVPASDKQIPQKIFLQGLTHSLFWSPCAPYLLGSEAGNWDALCETNTNHVHAAFVRGRRLDPMQAPRQRLAVVWQKDSLAPDLCGFNSEDENLPLDESNGDTYCSIAHLQNSPALRGTEAARLQVLAGVVGGDTSYKGWWLLCCEAGSSLRFMMLQ